MSVLEFDNEARRAFLKTQERHTGPAWAVWRYEDKIGTLVVTKITHRRFDSFYGLDDGDPHRHRTVRQKWIIQFFKTKAAAKAAIEAGKIAWASHDESMEIARKVYRDAEKLREQAMWNAVRR